MTAKQYRELFVIQEIYRQQSTMYKNQSLSIEEQIVGIIQPHIRPIVRGKANAPVEFGAKLSVSLTDGYAFIDTLSWDAYHEGIFLKESIESYKERITKTDKPYLVTEYNGHMFPTKKFDNESRRIEQALRHLNVMDRVRGEEEISGAIGWCMFDYNTHKDFGSGDKICYHGVMDMYRIPKYAAFVYGSQQDKIPVMHVASSFNIGEYDGSLLDDIYVFTNCDYIKLYKNEVYINTFYPDKKSYPNVLHPPIKIDDLIGDAIGNNEKFSESDARIVKNLLISVSKNGAKLGLLDTLKMALVLHK